MEGWKIVSYASMRYVAFAVYSLVPVVTWLALPVVYLTTNNQNVRSPCPLLPVVGGEDLTTLQDCLEGYNAGLFLRGGGGRSEASVGGGS